MSMPEICLGTGIEKVSDLAMATSKTNDDKHSLSCCGGKITLILLQIPRDAAQLRQAGNSCAAVYKGHGGSVLDLAASPEADKFVTASQDKTLRIWPTGLKTS